MACFYPMHAWWANYKNPSGKRSLVFKKMDAYKGGNVELNKEIQLPCGQCVGCKLERSRQWAMRCLHEASLHENNCFLTLTYDNENLPKDWSLNKCDLQKFWKRLRKRYPQLQIRYFACGEYGDINNRPHYHACVFNWEPEDKKLWKITNGNRLYTSKILEELWPKGFIVVGNVTFDSAAYVARYIMKKVTGKYNDPNDPEYKNAYEFIDGETGQTYNVNEEYTCMSKGIGKEWYKQFSKDAYPKDYITVNGLKMKPPKFYDKLFEMEDPQEMRIIKKERLRKAQLHEENQTYDRLVTREKVLKLKITQLKRPEQ